MLSEDLRNLVEFVRSRVQGDGGVVLVNALEDCRAQALGLEGWFPRSDTLPDGVVDLAQARHDRESKRAMNFPPTGGSAA
ncbi:hypothetical protein [Rhodospirillum sp. A1_3_36]|uniref:hypothetical protein n=1 Tax=Rhodospirillum sp. A1_3_36 TaxID=3391666 RepID=UPI0039A5A545